MPATPLTSIRPLYAFLDPHGGARNASHARLKKVASQAAICVGGTDGRNYFILDAWAARCPTEELVERMYDMVDRWDVHSIGGEANGLAGLFLDAVLRDAKWRKRRLPLVHVNQPTHQEKDYRIRTILQPLVGHGRFFVRHDLTALVTQITAFPLSPMKDLIDCAASLCRFIPPRPPRIDRDAQLVAKLKYLRDRGVDPRVIEQTARGQEAPWNSSTATPSPFYRWVRPRPQPASDSSPAGSSA